MIEQDQPKNKIQESCMKDWDGLGEVEIEGNVEGHVSQGHQQVET
jgi:hypothetical protein